MKFLHLVVCVAAGLILGGQSLAAGIPVVDVSNLAQNIATLAQEQKQLLELVQQVKTAKDQLLTAKDQLTSAKATFSSLTGSRGLSNLLNTPGVRQALPAGFMDSVDAIRNFGTRGATPGAKSIYEQIKRFGCDQQFAKNEDLRRLCETQAYSTPTTLSMVRDSVKRSESRTTQLQGMLTSIDKQGDAKAAADLQNRIQIESAMLANENMMMQMALQSQEMERKLVQQQLAEETMKKIQRGDRTTSFQ